MDTQLKCGLQVKLEEIAGILSKSINRYNTPGVLSGISGLALFMFYYSRFTGIAKYAYYGIFALKKAIDMIDAGYSYHTYCIGITGLAWVCEHLVRHKFLEQSDISFVGIADYVYILVKCYIDYQLVIS
ncbi:MAG: hypothetical protein LBG96_10445 [Tannerella sp.]|jgi:hypothetical protein|nr:hypothetical protein [Tannerella sp.]